MSISTKATQKKVPSNKFVFRKQANHTNVNKQNSPVQSILSLHQTIGNQVVQRLFESGFIQGKLTIGKPNDKYEQEADRVADEVMRMPVPQVQRQSEEEEEEMLQTKPIGDQITPLIQRQVEPEEEEEAEPEKEEEETIQTKSEEQTPQVTSSLESKINALQGGGQTLPVSERAFFEPRFGTDFSNVRVHNDNRAGLIARSINARAFTHGRDVVFGSAQYAPGTSEGRRLMAHELTHVVQQQSSTNQICRQTPKSGRGPIKVPEGWSLAKLDEYIQDNYVKVKRSWKQGGQIGSAEHRFDQYKRWWAARGKRFNKHIWQLKHFGYIRVLPNYITESYAIRTTIKKGGKVVINNMSFQNIFTPLHNELDKITKGRYLIDHKMYIEDILIARPEAVFINKLSLKMKMMLNAYLYNIFSDLQYMDHAMVSNTQSKKDKIIGNGLSKRRKAVLEIASFDDFVKSSVNKCKNDGENFKNLAINFNNFDKDLHNARKLVSRLKAVSTTYGNPIRDWYNKKDKKKNCFMKLGGWTKLIKLSWDF